MTDYLSSLLHQLPFTPCSHLIRNKDSQTQPNSKEDIPNAPHKLLPFYSIYGIADFGDVNCLIFATQCKLVANIINAPIFQITQLEYVPLSNKKLSKEFHTSISMFNEMLKHSCFYFSPKYDITNCFQKHIQMYGMDLSSIKIDIERQSNNKFLVNRQFTKYFKENSMLHLIYPIIEGSVCVCLLIRVHTQ